MSRLRGYAAAGLRILKTKPAFAMQFGHVPGLITAGPIVLLVAIFLLVGSPGHSLPVPPHKPDMASLILEQRSFQQAAYQKGGSRDTGPYISPLKGMQMDLYREIFRLQGTGAFDQADVLMNGIKDKSLLGHVLAQRYLHADYKASFEELKNWLSLYADHPQSERIARLANIRMEKEKGVELPKVVYAAPAIEAVDEPGMTPKKRYTSETDRTAQQDAAVQALIKSIRKDIQKYEPSSALAQLTQDPAAVYLDSVEKDRMKALVASGYLYAGKMEEAARLSAQALRGSQAYAPQAGWVHGLVQWQYKNYAQSARSFGIAATSPYASGSLAAAAAFWAARADQAAGHERRSHRWLEKAAAYPKSFYGLLASAALGRDLDIDWRAPDLTRSQEKEILATPAGMRAEKLLAAGQVNLAEDEIRGLYVRGNNARKSALLAFSYNRKLPALSMKLAHAVAHDQDAALYPSMPWIPKKGYRIDRALLHAIVRQESHFNATAENKGSGATGLMQLMPNTAFHVAGENKFHDYEGRSLLKTPEISLDLGQDYVEELLNNDAVGQDLLSLAIAYNAGPGTLAKWKSERAGMDDPLLFIETIPYTETRNYVERVMANYWMYRKRFDQSDDTLQALANGKWARYAALDKGAVKFADAR